MKNFNNKTVWITGASDGIGKELSIQLAKMGARIILTARNKDKLNAVKTSLNGNNHVVLPLDLLNINAIQAETEKLINQVGSIDVLINNAGVSQRALAKDTVLDVDRKLMEINHFAVVALTKAVMPQMQANKSGLIVTISSVAGKLGTPLRSAYCASKHAVIGFMDSVRAELTPYNVNVMVVTPGSVQTNISKNALQGDGNKHNIVDPAIKNGITVENCAKQIINGMQNQTPELLIAKGKERFAVYAKRFFPKLLFNMVAKIKTT